MYYSNIMSIKVTFLSIIVVAVDCMFVEQFAQTYTKFEIKQKMTTITHIKE